MTQKIAPSLAQAAEALVTSGLFGAFDRSFAEQLLARGTPCTLPNGGILFRQGDAGDTVFVLMEGELEVRVDIGSEQVRMAILAPYQLVGEIAVFADQPRIATVLAHGPASLLRLDAEQVLSMVGDNPQACRAIIADLGRRLATVNTPLAFLSTATQLLRNDRMDGEALAALAEKTASLGPFAHTFGEMVREIRAKQERQQDMAMARRIQQSVLPQAYDAAGGPVAIHAFFRPMKEVGGDLFDYFMVDDRRLAVAIADVSGKGVPAALFMVMFRTLLRAVATPGMEPQQVLTRVNAMLAADNEAGMFVTVFFALLDLDSGRMAYVNAGHDPATILAADGRRHQLAANGVAVGMLDDTRYGGNTVLLAPGDLMFLYTDGVTEAFSPAREQFGEERLQSLLEELRGGDADRLVEAVVRAVEDFAAGQEQSDDLTCLALTFRPSA